MQNFTDEEVDEHFDALEVLGAHNLAPVIVDMMTRFGGETAETAMIIRFFNCDPDADLIWQTHFAKKPSDPIARARENALLFGLYTLFSGDPDTWGTDDFFTEQFDLDHWRSVTRDLQRIDALVQPNRPWLYGWTAYGIYLAYRMCELPFQEADPCGEVGFEFLPGSLDELLENSSVEAARTIELRLVDLLLEPIACEAGLTPAYGPR